MGSRMVRTAGAKRSDRVDDTIFESLPAMHGNAAGIDIGSEKHYVSVPYDRSEQPTRTFGCFTPDILAMAEWTQLDDIHTYRAWIAKMRMAADLQSLPVWELEQWG